MTEAKELSEIQCVAKSLDMSFDEFKAALADDSRSLPNPEDKE